MVPASRPPCTIAAERRLHSTAYNHSVCKRARHVCRVEFIPDTKVANAATFEIQREDHTVGDPLVMQLHEDPAVAFAAYKIPHPLEHRLLIKVKTTSAAKTPAAVYNNAIDCLTKEIQSIKDQFRERVSEVVAAADFAPHETHLAAQPVGAGVYGAGAGAFDDDEYGTRYEYGAGADAMAHDIAFEGAS